MKKEKGKKDGQLIRGVLREEGKTENRIANGCFSEKKNMNPFWGGEVVRKISRLIWEKEEPKQLSSKEIYIFQQKERFFLGGKRVMEGLRWRGGRLPARTNAQFFFLAKRTLRPLISEKKEEKKEITPKS